MNKRLRELFRELKQAEKSGNIEKRIDIILEIGDSYRLDGLSEDAIAKYKEVVSIAECNGYFIDASFAQRALCEIYAELNQKRSACEHAERFQRMAEISGSASQVQLSFHVTAWVYQKLWVFDPNKPREVLVKAYDHIKKSIDYIKLKKDDIDADKKAIASGGNSAKRKAHAECLGASIAACLNLKSDANRLWNTAYTFAERANDNDLKFELWLNKLDFSWEDPLKVAQRLLNCAPPKKKAAAFLELSQAYIFGGRFDSAHNTLLDCLVKFEHQLIESDREILHNRIVFLHKYFSWLKTVEEITTSRQRRRKCLEHMADALCEYSEDRLELRRVAVEYYKKMLKESDTDRERLPACVSLAITYKELKEFRLSLEYFKKVLTLEERLNVSEHKIIDTRCSIFITKCSGKLETSDSLKTELESLEEALGEKYLALKAAIYKAYGQFLSCQGDVSNCYLKNSRILELDSQSQESISSSECYEDSDDSNDEDEFDFDDIIRRSRIQAKQKNSFDELCAEKTKTNSHGETRLHVAARNTDSEYLKLLLKAGYDINKRDNGGWTPLHEAVSANVRENVLILLRAKAKVDIKSKETLEGDDTQIAGGITPLMDACQNGYFDIAKDLVNFGAKLDLENEEGWTALHFLKASISELEDDDSIIFAEKLASEIENKMKANGISIKPAPARRKSLPNATKNAMKRQASPELSPSKENLNAYKSVIGKLSKNSNRLSREGRLDEFDDLDDIPSTRSHRSRRSNETSFDAHDYDRPSTSSPIIDLDFKESSFIHTKSFNSDDNTEFIDVDRGRKRRNNASTKAEKRPKRSSREWQPSTPNPVFDNLEENSPFQRNSSGYSPLGEYDTRSSSNRRFSNTYSLPTQRAGTMNGSVSQRSSASTPAAPTQVMVTVVFEDSNSRPVGPKKKIYPFPSDSFVSTVANRCREELPLLQRNIIIVNAADKAELDEGIPLSFFSAPIQFLCSLRDSTSEMVLKTTGCSDEKILSKLRDLDISGNLDISDIEISSIENNFFSAIKQSSKKASSLILDYYEPIEIVPEELCNICAEDITVLSVSFTSIGYEFFQLLSQKSLCVNLTTLNLTSSGITSGHLLSALLSSNKLTSVQISGLKIESGVDNIFRALRALPKLSFLNFSYSPWATSENIAQLLPSLEEISSLYLNGNDLEEVEFEPLWMPKVKRLSLAGCKIGYWDHLMELLQMGQIEMLDLSCTALQLHHLEAYFQSCSENTTSMRIRLVRCECIEMNEIPRLLDIFKQYINNSSGKPRLEFSSKMEANLREGSVFAEKFLISSI